MGAAMKQKTTTAETTRAFAAAALAVLVSGASTAFAFAGETSMSPVPEKFMSPFMAKAFQSASMACRLHVQKVLASHNFYSGPFDGAWGPKTAAGIAAYAGGGQDLRYGLATLAGAKGIVWHIGFEEWDCPAPPYTS